MKTTKQLWLASILLSIFISSFTYAQQSMALHSEVNKLQPMTGIVFWSDNGNDLSTLGNKVQLEYSYLVYSDVIQQEGQYDWSSVDNLLAQVGSNGRQAILRFRYTYPGVTTPSVPTYIRNSNGYTDQYESVEGSNTYIPDWSSQELEDFTLEFFTKFAERYDNDARLAFVQVGFGSYSEYHLYDGPLRFGETFPTKDYQKTFLQHVDSVFQETQWSISIDAGSDDYTDIADDNSLLNLGYGLFDDSFLHEEHSTSDGEYNRSLWLTFGADRADNYAAGGELNYYSTEDQETVLNVQGPYGFTFEEMAEMYDITYMIGNDQLSYQTAARIEDAGMATGYSFEVTAYTSNGSSTQLTIKNNGIAPIYYDAYPTVSGVKSTTSLKGLIAGQSRDFTINTGASGEDLTISCDRLVSGQEIQYDANIDGGTVSNTLTVTTPSTFSANGATQSITITANVDWSVSESSSWIFLNTTSGSNNGTINVTASANSSTSSRSATITVTGGSITRSITISQAAADDTPVTTYTTIPALIEAEDYADKSDSPKSEASQDTDNGTSMGWISANDYLTYTIDVPNSGEYTLDFRVASKTNGTQFDIYQGSSFLDSISSPATGDWYDWETVSKTVDLTAGEQTIKLVATGGGWNINWINFSEPTNTGVASFIPDPNKKYYIDAPIHNLRLAASGESEDAYTTGTSTTGADVEWKFVAKTGVDESWHIQRADDGNLPRLRTDGIDNNADMQATTSSGIYTYFNFQEGAIDGAHFITLTNGPSNYQRLQINSSGQVKMVTTASNGTWESFTITEVNDDDNSTSCSSGTNLALNAAIIDFSSEQNSDNGVSNLNDGSDGNRWSASGFPQYAVIDLGEQYTINQVNLMPYSDRAYQFLVEGSTSSATSGFSTLTDATGNTSGGSQITKSFSTQTVRYVKLTITGASGYTGTWSSIEDFQVLCAGTSSKNISLNTSFDITAYPNPFTSSITVDVSNTNQIISTIQLVDLSGKVIVSETSGTSINNLDDVASGMYLLQLLNAKGQIIAIEKVIK